MVFPYLTPRKLTSAFRSITMQICVTYLNGTSSAILAHWEKRERGREKEEEGEEKGRERKGRETGKTTDSMSVYKKFIHT